MKKGITINLHIGEIVVTGRTHNQTSVANAVVAELNRILSTAFEITKDNTETQRVNPSRAVSIERYYSQIRYTAETRSKDFDWLGKAISHLDGNSQCRDEKKKGHNTHEGPARNGKRCLYCGHYISQKPQCNTTQCAGHSRNRTLLENNDRILIQIPKNLKVSSIQFEFYPKEPEHLESLFSDSF